MTIPSDQKTLADIGRRELVRDRLSFWRWLRREGLSRAIFSWWNIIHIGVGSSLGLMLTERMSDMSRAVLLPLCSVLVGLTFAWGGNALALLQTPELQRAGKTNDGNQFYTFLFGYQFAILSLLAVLVIWGVLALGLANDVPLLYRWAPARLVGRAFVFSLSSFVVRECWHVVLGTQTMLAMRHLIQDARDTHEKASERQ